MSVELRAVRAAIDALENAGSTDIASVLRKTLDSLLAADKRCSELEEELAVLRRRVEWAAQSKHDAG